jgi:hypothetical protein
MSSDSVLINFRIIKHILAVKKIVDRYLIFIWYITSIISINDYIFSSNYDVFKRWDTVNDNIPEKRW